MKVVIRLGGTLSDSEYANGIVLGSCILFSIVWTTVCLVRVLPLQNMNYCYRTGLAGRLTVFLQRRSWTKYISSVS